jgi:predicted GNAT family acetyltransferase
VEGVAELAGLGVLEGFRRRGIGAAVTAELTRRALASGTRLVWLTPGDEGAERIYARAGFAVEGEMVHLRR